MILGFESWMAMHENDNLEAASVAKKVYSMLKSAGNEVELAYQTEALSKKGDAKRIRNAESDTINVAYYVDWVHIVPVDEETADYILSKFESDTLEGKKSSFGDNKYSVTLSIKERKQRKDFDVNDYSYKAKKNKNDRKRTQE